MSLSRQKRNTVPRPADLAEGGESKKFKVAISKLITKGGDEIAPPPSGVTVIVGGNNSGKSTFLRDIYTKVSRSSQTVYRTMIVEGVLISREGNSSDAFSWLQENANWKDSSYKSGFSGLDGSVVSVPGVKRFLELPKISTLGEMSGILVRRDKLHERIKVVSAVEQREDLLGAPTEPIHKIQDNPQMFEMICDFSERIFRQSLTLDRLGKKTQLRVGSTDVDPPKVDSLTPEYIESLSKLEPLSDQGDGMRSLLGILLPLVASSGQIVLIDEPEAFLHPPQAKVVGRILGEIAIEKKLQIFLATHDKDLLVGLLESQAPMTIVRLDRNLNSTDVHQLNDDDIRKLWADPTLRFSNVLDGLFHRAVVLAEADGDCRFFAAAMDSASIKGPLPFIPGDILFVPVGGKDGFLRVVRSLKSIAVPTVVVADLDLLNDRRKLKLLLESLGGEWRQVESDYNAAVRPLARPKVVNTKGRILELIGSVLSDVEGIYDKDAEELVKIALRSNESPWQGVKYYGVSAFKGGISTRAVESLLEYLESVGLVLVREGELERLAPRVGRRKGPEWLTEALTEGAHLEDPAQGHISRVIASLAGQLKIDPMEAN